MSLISSSIANLVNGVSQQPYTMRLSSQAQEQINGFSSAAMGLSKRPPTVHVAKFLPDPIGNCFLHTINRDLTERYQCVFTDSSIRVFRLDGTEVVVNSPNGMGYLATSTPSTDIGVVTVADFSFIINKSVITATNTAVLPISTHEALVWVRAGNYSSNYSVAVNDVQAVYTTLDASTVANADSIRTDFIAAELTTQLIDGLHTADPSPLFVVTRLGSTIHILSDSVDFTIITSDSQGDTSLKLVHKVVQSFTDLPVTAVDGFKVAVVTSSSTDNPFAQYFVQYAADATNPNGGVWKESAQGGEQFSFNASTMAHTLVREADGTFTFRELVWDPREAGDLTTVPMPSFIGKSFNDVFFYKNRLGFLSDENIIFSRAGEFFNFFRASAIQTVDSDVIDIAVTFTKVAILKHAVPWNETLLFFSDSCQFILSKTDLLSPKSVSVTLTTQFDSDLTAKPVGAGQNVYFGTAKGASSGLREYLVDPVSLQNDATDITSYIPSYIPAGLSRLSASTVQSILVCLTTGQSNSLFIYKYFWSGSQKLQAAWSRWEFGTEDSILSCEFVSNNLELVISRPDGVYLETVKLDEVPQPCYLDRLIPNDSLSAAYDPTTDTTAIAMPFTPLSTETYAIVSRNGASAQRYSAASSVPFTLVGTTFTVPGKLERFFVGRTYAFRYTLSTLIVRELGKTTYNLQSMLAGRLQIHNMTLAYSSSGYFRAEVTAGNKGLYRYEFSSNASAMPVGSNDLPHVEDGNFRFPVMSRNTSVTITIVNDSFLPCSFLSAEWEAFLQLRSQRI